MPHSILIVDDEPGIRESIAAVLGDEGYAVDAVASGEECLRRVKQKSYDLVLLDVWLPKMDGTQTLQRLRVIAPDCAVVMISGHATIETAVRATKLGAFDFIEKPLSIENLTLVVRQAIEQKTSRSIEKIIDETLHGESTLIGDSVAMRALRGQIAIVAPTGGRVLISGESGTGKELVAHAIHAQSSRAALPFIELNCAAIPEELIESELFGHTRGAFTGATSFKRGKFDLANGATLFLDEVGDMSPRVQAKMLRVLEEGRFEPVGGNAVIHTDVRVIAATNKRLDEAIEQGSFRADLFYRLHVIPFEVPPLREHLEDVPQLVNHFNERFAKAHDRQPKIFTNDALDKLMNYSYPGNVRELRNVVERLLITHAGEQVTAEDLSSLSSDEFDGDAAHINHASFRFPSFKDANEAYQREFIRRKLAETDGNVTRAAELMGVDRSHLYRRMKALGIKARDESQS